MLLPPLASHRCFLAPEHRRLSALLIIISWFVSSRLTVVFLTSRTLGASAQTNSQPTFLCAPAAVQVAPSCNFPVSTVALVYVCNFSRSMIKSLKVRFLFELALYLLGPMINIACICIPRCPAIVSTVAFVLVPYPEGHPRSTRQHPSYVCDGRNNVPCMIHDHPDSARVRLKNISRTIHDRHESTHVHPNNIPHTIQDFPDSAHVRCPPRDPQTSKQHLATT